MGDTAAEIRNSSHTEGLALGIEWHIRDRTYFEI